MGRKLKTVIVLLMLALLPVRVLASVTVGDCAVTHHAGTAAPHDVSSHEDASTMHSHGGAHDEHGHCASASFVACAPTLSWPTHAASARVALHELFAAGFVPDHLDPPPLGL